MRLLYSILLFIPLFVAYYFIIAMVSGFILGFLGEYMHYYGIIIGMALSPLLTIITILKINKKDKNLNDEE